MRETKNKNGNILIELDSEELDLALQEWAYQRYGKRLVSASVAVDGYDWENVTGEIWVKEQEDAIRN